LYNLLRPNINQVLVGDPHRNPLLKVGNKSDRIDAPSWSNCCAAGIFRGLSRRTLEKSGEEVIAQLSGDQR
jgi:hypothetical protein